MSYHAPRATGAYLRAYLSPLETYLARADVTDIFINRPGEIWVETIGAAPERIEIPELDETLLDRLARQIASLSNQGISRQNPLLGGSLPDGTRIQIVAPPATRGPLAMALRKQAMAQLSLADCVKMGLFENTVSRDAEQAGVGDTVLDALYDQRDFAGFLSAAVKARKNIVVSGGTSTGKTTFLNALIREIPDDERIIAIEDTPEVDLCHPNAVGLVASKSDLAESKVDSDDLLQAALRMRPSRIIMGELRGREAYSFLRAVNTGHPGSITTVHADSPRGAIEQLSLMVLQAGTTLTRPEIETYLRTTIPIFVQVGRRNGRRLIDAIQYRRAGDRVAG